MAKAYDKVVQVGIWVLSWFSYPMSRFNTKERPKRGNNPRQESNKKLRVKINGEKERKW